tara:strand:+ start:437 stop:1426 length:990 start_codon:yes stop_codon:yes gene_type:complete
MQSYLFTFLIVSFATTICGKLYIHTWQKIYTRDVTPTGFGILYPVILVVYFFLNFEIFSASIKSSLIILFAGLIYLIDDMKGLHHWLRIFIAFIFGSLMFWIEYINGININFTMLGLLLFFGILSLGLTNMMNFNDGVDLNLALIILLSGLILFFYTNSENLIFKNIGVLTCAFAVGFGFLNKKPNTLFLGDAGAFVFALVFLFFILKFFTSSGEIPLELIAVLAIPMFDVFYVMLIRLYYKHNMLSRNYLHLYQRLRIIYGGFYHLIPQVINIIGVIFFAKLIEEYFIEKIWTLLVSGFLFTPTFYIICRFFFIERSYFFGDGELNEK